ncbi:hypothetical protein EB118_01600 [bacterium]|nr:hypothetical protein [bacterium]NBX98526.1 hypothetical protein [bacterium]NDC93838.1 hypothetical protein [bacterium]NDD84205.1 hypothetical protein [bacterium]NDG28784.1 hypothetical protein [bacterium]
MKLYRFSPIENKEQLLEAVKHIHFACYELCKQSFGDYLPNAGNMGVFCHYDDEFEQLVAIRKEMTEPSDNPEQKYFALYEPIVIPAKDGVPQAEYTHLYIRKPDPYRHHVGDVDFYLEPEQYDELKQLLLSGKQIKGARVFPRNDLDMVELYDPNIDVLGYVSTNTMSEKVRVKLSEETNL